MFVKIFQIIVIAILSVWNIYALKTGLDVCVPQPYEDFYIKHTLSVQEYEVAVNEGKVKHRTCR